VHAEFDDYQGCNALTCGKCGCGFCALCLADCGPDAHPHYYEVHGKGEGAGVHDRPLFERTHRARRCALVAAAVRALEAEGPELQRALVAELAKADLPGLGISPDDVLARIPALRAAEPAAAPAVAGAHIVAAVRAYHAAEAQLAQSLAPIRGAMYEAKVAGNVRFAQLYHALVGAMGRKAAALATDDFDAHDKEKAALNAALAALAAAGAPD